MQAAAVRGVDADRCALAKRGGHRRRPWRHDHEQRRRRGVGRARLPRGLAAISLPAELTAHGDARHAKREGWGERGENAFGALRAGVRVSNDADVVAARRLRARQDRSRGETARRPAHA